MNESKFIDALVFIMDYSGFALAIGFALIAVAIIVRIIRKSSKRGEAAKMVRDVVNIWDPVTGVPRSMVNKQEIAIVREAEEKEGK
ncbi:MAG: hypothetical protein LBL36_00705 [Clostridiales Family XIII bacterium]|nr:hypothetical protein [Clostridiales Family XIII bacterium]